MRRRIVPAVISVASLLTAFSASAGTTLPFVCMKLLGDDGSVAGVYLAVDGFDPETGPEYLASLFETTEGAEILEFSRLDSEKGVSYQRLEDISTGWWVELEEDFGFGNLGSPLDYADPMDWAIALRDRSRQERAPTSYSMRFSDGTLIRWVIPYGKPAEGDKVQREAMVKLAAFLTAHELPESTSSGLEKLARLEKGMTSSHLTAERLFGYLWTAYKAAFDVRDPRAGQALVVKADTAGREQDRMLRVIRRNTVDLMSSVGN